MDVPDSFTKFDQGVRLTMRRFTTLGATIFAAVLVLSATVVAGASAHGFKGSKETGLITATVTSPMVFTVPGITVTCTAGTGDTTYNGPIPLTITLTMSYSMCTSSVPGQTVDPPVVVQNSVLNSDTLAVSGGNVTRLVLLAAAGKCEVTIPGQTLKTVKFKDAAGDVLPEEALSSVESSATGTGCNPAYTSNKTGKIAVTIRMELVGGEIEWV